MNTTVYIMRHGIAEDDSPTGLDEDRRLTDEGRRRVVEVAEGLRAIDVKPQAILSSPLPRALETATLTASQLAPDIEVKIEPTLSTAYDAGDVVGALEKLRSIERLMLVGHQPQLGELASILLTGAPSLAPLPFKKAGVAAIEVASLPPHAPGALLWFMTPKQLRALAGS